MKPELSNWNSFGNGPIDFATEASVETTEDQHAAQRHDKGRDFVEGDEIALQAANHRSDEQQTIAAGM